MNSYPENVKLAEHSLVANTLLDPKCFDEAGLSEDHFYDPRLRLIWGAVGRLKARDADVDMFTVANEIGERMESLGGITFFSQLLVKYQDFAPSPAMAKVVRENWLRTQVGKLSDDVTHWLSNGESASGMLSKLQQKVETLGDNTGRELPTLKDTHERESSRILADLSALDSGEQIHFGLPCGLGIGRVVPGGIPLGKVTALYGESGNFKTTLKNNIVWGIAKHGGGRVIDFSFEDDNELTTQRFIGYHSGVSYGKIATRDLGAEQRQKVVSLGDKSLEIAERVYMGGEVPPNIDEIIRLSRYYARSRSVRCVVLDYIQLISTEKDELDRSVRLLQLSAKRDNLSYIIVSQVKQDVDFRASKGEDARPRITDMLGSSSFRTAPKLSIGVYRPAKYHKVPSSSKRQGVPFYKDLVAEHPEGQRIYSELLELWVQKNVLGEPDICIPVRVHLQTGRMSPLPPEVTKYL